MISQQHLIDRIKAYDPDADEDLINRAYVFGLQSHGGQKRASGEDYFMHPIEVAMILAQWNVDSATIATALLHDVLEDTHITAKQLKALFGKEVSFLVEGVTKLSKMKEVSVRKAQAENFRKFVLAVSKDIRVLLVKLADRLHNMRTLGHIKSPESRQRIAQETMEIYVPLAERTGMHEVATELADLSFKYLESDTYEVLYARLQKLKENSIDLIKSIEDRLGSVLRENGLSVVISGRQKTVYSIWKKMEYKNLSFDQLTDLMAFRVIVHTVGECYQALGVIHSIFSVIPGKFKDYISTPKPNGYSSLHTTVIGPENHKIEIQIRTQQMDSLSELGFAAHWKYKQYLKTNTPGGDGERYYPWIKGILKILEATSDPEEFLSQTKLEMYTNEVFCFTPTGEVIALPHGATCIDFAYAVHTAMGDECVRTLVNGKKQPLWTKLENGDKVKIITRSGHIPPLYWEEFAKTAKARMHIRKYAHDNVLKRGEFLFEDKVAIHGFARKKSLDLLLKVYGFSKEKAFFEAIGMGKINPEEMIEKLSLHEKEGKPEVSEKNFENTQGTLISSKIVIKGEEKPYSSRQVFFQERRLIQGPCCRPEPFVPISGVLRTPHTIEIHKVTCTQLGHSSTSKKAAFPVEWDEILEPCERGSQVLVRITIKSSKESLGKLIASVADEKILLRHLKEVQRENGWVTYGLVLDVSSIQELEGLLHTIRKLKIAKEGEWRSYSGEVAL